MYKEEMLDKTVCIIGAGPSGMMAAISSARNGFRPLVIDHTKSAGRKLLVCGAGRCNITNKNLSLDRFYCSNKNFVKSVLEQFNEKHCMQFFKDLGVELYEEDDKAYPITNDANTILTSLLLELKSLGIDIKFNINIKRISVEHKETKDQLFKIITDDNQVYKSRFLILACGGKTYPALGSDGSGFELAKSFGHTVVELVPSAVSLVAKSAICHKLQGMRWDVEVTSIIDNKKIKSCVDNMMITQYGFSGPAILNISRDISIALNRFSKSDVDIEINFFPNFSKEELKKVLYDRWSRYKDRNLAESLVGILPNKFGKVIADFLNIDSLMAVGKIGISDRERIVDFLNRYKVRVKGTRGWNEAEFSCGGIRVDEVKERTLESHLVRNLYFAGEILDVDADIGGFNLTWAWSSGWVAGRLLCN